MRMRPSLRQNEQLREITIERHYTKHAEGSVLISCGDTKVLCNASVTQGVPRFLKGSGKGWVTAEYSMLPRATNERTAREAARGKQSGRTLEIQRLIARSLRAAVNLKALGDHSITIDCDVLQADGGTRTAAITGACVALVDALSHMRAKGMIKKDPLIRMIAAISVGIFKEEPVLDLDYLEDSQAETDMNVIMTDTGEFIEIQGTAEAAPFSVDQLQSMLALARTGTKELFRLQRTALRDESDR